MSAVDLTRRGTGRCGALDQKGIQRRTVVVYNEKSPTGSNPSAVVRGPGRLTGGEREVVEAGK